MPTPAERPRIVAHRGASHDAPENTQAAFRRAWDLGVEAIELDVRLSRDEHVVVIHDTSTQRVAGVDRPVADQTLAELQALDVGAGERIPTLAEVFATVPKGRTVFVEIKSGRATVPVVARAIRLAPADIVVALQGYSADTLAALAAELPGVAAYWTVDPPVEGDRALPYATTVLDEAVARGFAGVALDHRGVTDPLIDAARARGVAVDVWTINDATELARWVRDTRVRWIETDRPALVAVPGRR